MGDKLAFDSHHVLELIFSARNIQIKQDESNGCLLRISQKEYHSNYYASNRTIMHTDFVIDNRHPRFSRTLIYDYYPTKNNDIKLDLCVSDENDAVAVGSATINLMNLLVKHNGYLYVPIITDFYGARGSIKHRRSLPDLTSKSKQNLRADENPEFTRTPCIIIAAKSFNSDKNKLIQKNSKIQKLTGNELNSGQLKQYQSLPKPSLPTNLKIVQWSDGNENKIKTILSHNIETSDFRQAVKLNKKTLIECNYFSTKKSEKSTNEHIANLLLDLWKKCLDAYGKSSIQQSFKNTLLSIMASLANRFEFDLSHIQHWQHDQIHIKALTTFQWERIMKQYYKLFIRTAEISLNIIEEEKEPLSEEQDLFSKQVIGLCAIRMAHMQHKLLPLLVQSINRTVQESKAKRYEFLVNNYPDEDTKKGYMKHTWQEDYVAQIANMHNNNNNALLNDPFYLTKSPSINPYAWKWFAPVDTETKVSIKSDKQKKCIKNNWEYIIKFICTSISNYSRGNVYWSKVEGFPRIQQLLIQAIIWTPLNDEKCIKMLDFVSSLMEIPEMRFEIGSFGKAIIRNTDAMHPTQVEICFKYLREWITNSGCDEGDDDGLGLLPYSFCYDELLTAIKMILEQEEWQIICVVLSFLLHHCRLFPESYRRKVFGDILIKKHFLKLFCHWNRLVRKYYFMLLLYGINRTGYFNEERRKKCFSDLSMDQDVINTGHRCYVLFDSMTFLVTKDYLRSKLKAISISTSKQKLILIDTKGNRVQFKSTLQTDEKDEIDHLKSFYCDMTYCTKIESDCELIELLNLEITQIKAKRKEIDNRYRVYIDSAFKQFADLCERYKKIQLTKRNNWQFGEVLIPTIMYHVRDRDKHLNKFQKTNTDSHKFVQ